ncbi:hypothetical protein CEXT_469161 [Caerostris extrusa]|uniref:Uncharacterized protein n=1 Tax=Caerostris extrusa TaxID=172846 RepID=A0AAV4R5W5_CAEEX|nr:hypothetical protein CEXT_469161 [Caerostris extrusa]
MAFFVKWCSKIKRPQTIEPEAYLRRKILKLTRQSDRESHHKDGHTKEMSELFTRSLVLVERWKIAHFPQKFCLWNGLCINNSIQKRLLGYCAVHFARSSLGSGIKVGSLQSL